VPPKAAKLRGKELSDSYSFWFRRQYSLSPLDPRFLDLTPEEVEAEYWAHHYADAPASEEEYEDDDFDLDSILAASSEDEWEDVINDRA